MLKWRKLQVWEWLVCVGIVGCLAGIFLPAFQACACGGPKTNCMSNVKQQATALLVYLADHDERLPNRDAWMDAADSYVEQTSTFHDPLVKSPEEYGYSFDSRLSLRPAVVFPDPDRQSMVFDSINFARNASDPFVSSPKPGRHGDGNITGYLDGHVKWLKDPSGVKK